MSIKVTKLDEETINLIGHAFGYYDYKEEHGLIDAFPSRDHAAAFICGYVRMAIKSGMLYTIGENNEAFIAYKLPKQKIKLNALFLLAKGMLSSMKLKELIRFSKIMKKGTPGLRKKLDKEKKPYIYVGLVCVLEKYQHQGFMRKVLELAFKEGNRLNLPVVLDTDCLSKCEMYIHLGMELAGTRRFSDYGVLYDLIKYPDSLNN